MNLDDIKEILSLVREHDLEEFELERDGLKVRVRKAGSGHQHIAIMPPAVAAPAMPASAPAAVPATASAGGAAPTPLEPEGVELAVIKSPIVGTLYLAPEPGARPFVQVGDQVKKGQVMCIIEAMKLMNEIECDCTGEVATIYVQNAQPVQFGDRLFAVRIA